MARTNQTKITKYRKPRNINIGMIVFMIVLLYVIVSVIGYFRQTHVVRYEVKEGSLAMDTIYRGIALREEEVEYAENAGYVNYYTYEGERVAKYNPVYTIDETGRLNDMLENIEQGENSLSNRELREFRSDIVNFVHGFDEMSFDRVYDFKRSLGNSISRLANINMLKKIRELDADMGVTSIINHYNAPTSGIVSYWYDGYENLAPSQVTEDMFDESKYERTDVLNNSLVEVGEPVYKVCTGENWSVIFPIDEERGRELENEGYVKVIFLKNQYQSWGQVSLLYNEDGTYLQLTFSNSMITFLGDRFVDVELIIHDEKGLKIPVSSIAQKDFFLIPADFVIADESGNKAGIMKQRVMEDSTISTELMTVDVYSYDSKEQEYYMSSDYLSVGDVLHKLDSQDIFVVSKRATLTGVYYMNKGYTDFREIAILYQNKEYAIVQANTKYGLNVYDYIVLDASAVRDDQFINQK